MLLPLQYLH
jgi:serine/threonine protein kinase